MNTTYHILHTTYQILKGLFLGIFFLLITSSTVLAKPQISPPPAASPASPRGEAPAELFGQAVVIDDFASPSGAIKEKIQEIRQEVREKVQQKLEEIKKKGSVRAYVGKITDITDQTLTLDTGRGQRKVLVDEETKIIGINRQTLKFENLKIDDLLIAMGIVDQEEVMTAKRIVLIPHPKVSPPVRRAVFGKILEIQNSTQVLTIVQPRKQEKTFKVKATNETKITKKIDNKMQKITFSRIAVDDRLVAVGTWDKEKEILTAKLIHIIPGKAIGLEKPTQPLSPTP